MIIDQNQELLWTGESQRYQERGLQKEAVRMQPQHNITLYVLLVSSVRASILPW